MERRLAAILAADVVGYSRLMGEDEAGTLTALKALRKELFAPEVAKHHGRIVKLMGDGALVEFPSVVDAVCCAADIQEAISERDTDVPEDRRIQLRIGINLGDVIIEGDDVYGDGVNIAARLEELAEPGGVYVSGKVHDEVRGKLELGFDDLGAQSVKNIAEPVRVYRVTAEPLASSTAPSSKPLPLPDKPSVAITEDIITELSRFPSLFVIARNSSFMFKGEAVDVSEVGRKLGVQYVVEGSIRKAGNRVRVTAQLIEAETGNHLWAERYDRDLEDIFAVQDEISQTISSTLADRVEGDRLVHAKSKDETGLAAYDLILRGRELARKYTRDDMAKAREMFTKATAKAREMFTKATELSPDNAQAWAWFALCLAWDFEGWWVEDPEQSLELAFQCATKAVQMDANVSQAQTSLAYTYLYKRQHDQAIHHFQRALALTPGDAGTICFYGGCLLFAGDAGEGLEEIARSERLNPMATALSEHIVLWRGMALYTLRRYEDALAALRELPNPMVEARGWLAAIYAQLGEDEAARAALADFEAHAREEFPTFPGDTPGGWTRYWWWMEPYRNDDDLEHVLEGLRKAGLDV
jgi:class 3 adenylate cyclase/TolB-like protein/Flp pilus assembly protein TadD